MIKLVMIFLAMGLPTLAMADQEASWTCQNDKVILASKTTYWGESSKVSQTLYALSQKGQPEGAYTAYFLKTSEDIGHHFERIIYGKNEVNGAFTLSISHPSAADMGDGTTIHSESPGFLSYSQGALKGENEIVKCVFE
jgi:hypothetical protein